MKNLITFFLFILLFFILFQCEDNSNITSLSDLAVKSTPRNSSSKKIELTHDQLFAELDNIARFLAIQRNSIAKFFPRKVLNHNGEAPLSNLKIAQSLPKTFTAFGGVNMTVTYALAKHSPVMNIKDQLRVAVDPDDFPIDETGSFIAYYFDSKGVLTKEKMDVETYNNSQPFPLLLVNVKPMAPLPCPPYCDDGGGGGGGGGGNNEGNPGLYISVRSVKLKTEHDGLGYEEFEVYERVANTNGIVATTHWLFDGNWHKDAAKRNRQFPDINKDQTYTMPSPIALAVINGTDKVGFHAIEDDYAPGRHFQVDNGVPNDHISEWTCKVWREDLGYAQWELLLFEIWGTAPPSPRGNDDIYIKGGFYGFTESTLTTPYTRHNDDMDMELYKEAYYYLKSAIKK